MYPPRLIINAVAIVVLLIAPGFIRAQNTASPSLTSSDLADGRSADLKHLPWKFRGGDDLAWAAYDLNDEDWAPLTSSNPSNEEIQKLNWHGRGWFRARFDVAEDVTGQPLAMRVWHWGASEIYLDGQLIHRFGGIEYDGEVEFNPEGRSFPLVFTQSGPHLLAVRYSYMQSRDMQSGWGRWLAKGDATPGFTLAITREEAVLSRLEQSAPEDHLDYAFVGLFFALGLVHLLLFLFYRAAAGNLFYSIFVAGLAITLWFNHLAHGGRFSTVTIIVIAIVRENVQSLAVISLLAFVYVEFARRVTVFPWILLAIWAVGFALHISQTWTPYQLTPTLLIVSIIDGLRVMTGALRRRVSGALIVFTGLGLMLIGVSLNISIARHFIQVPQWLHDLNLDVTVLSIPLAVSGYLARSFAQTNYRLANQLEQVRELSARQLEHERSEAELRLKHEQEKAENARRAQELEEARQLQLSMLPKKVPVIENLEIAAYTQPATEVGGDYYDFYVDAHDVLTIAVGDATGHGLKAGTLVAATKSLFNSLANETDINRIFQTSSLALKRMNLRGLFMAMTMLKVNGNEVILSIAGMPPVLVYRGATGEVEEVSIKAMPLGGPFSTEYEQRRLGFFPGDVMVIMSDGFTERFNEVDEMIGTGAAHDAIKGSAHLSPQEVIDALVRAGERWAGSRPQDDDVTFVVIKAKDRS